MRVFLLAKKPTRNGVEFWDLLGKQCDLTVAFEKYPDDNGVWEFSAAGRSFKSEFLMGISFGAGASMHFNIRNLVNDNPYDVYVVSDSKTSAEKSVIKEVVINEYKLVIASEGAFPDYDENRLTKSSIARNLNYASLYLSCGSACDAYFASYGVNMDKVYRYNYAAFKENDYYQSAFMTKARKDGLRRRFGLKNNYFISTIDFNPEQGIDILLDAWKYAGVKDYTLLIISDARGKKSLQKMVKRAALNDIVMLDYQPRELTRELIKMSKAFIYPARYDAWGLPVVEALSCGIPVISSYSVGAAHDLVQDGITGYVNNINEPISWGESMRDIIEREIIYNKMKSNIKTSMKAYTIESRVRKYIEVLKKAAIMRKR